MLPRRSPITLVMLWAVTAPTAFAGPKVGPAAADCAPSCERTLDNTKIHLVPEQSAMAVPKLELREVATTVPAMGLTIDFKEEKRTVYVTALKPREEEHVVKSTTMVPETHVDPCTHCQTIKYKQVCLTKIVKVTVMDYVQEAREVIVRVPVLTPVETSVVVKQLALERPTVPAVVTTYRVVTMPGTLTVPVPPVPPAPCLPAACGPRGH